MKEQKSLYGFEIDHINVWSIVSTVANAGSTLEETHPIIVEGQGHTAITNVEAFSGGNGALTNLGRSNDYMTVRGDQKCLPFP